MIAFMTILKRLQLKLRPVFVLWQRPMGVHLPELDRCLRSSFARHRLAIFQEVLECDFDVFGRFHRAALENGLYFPPSQYEAVFLSGTSSRMKSTF